MKQPLTTQEAAKRLNLSTARIRQLCIEGKFAGAWKAGRDWMIPQAAVDRRALKAKRNGI